MTNLSNLMKKAHELAKTFTGDYQARLSLALKIAWSLIKKGAKKMVELTGSVKQIKWAEDIREKLFARIEEGWELVYADQVEKGFESRAERMKDLIEEIHAQTSSAWFIENAKNDSALYDYLNSSEAGMAGRLLARAL